MMASRTPLRVLHVLHHSYRYPCGYRTRSENIVRFQRAEGLLPFVLTSSDHERGTPLSDPTDFSVRHCPRDAGTGTPGLREWRLMSVLRRHVADAIEQVQPHVVHAHSPVLVALPALRAARRRGLPFVYEVRDLWENASVDLGKFSERSWRYRFARAADSYVLARADAVTVICESMRQEIAARTGRRDHIFVAANGVELEALQPSRGDATRRRWRLPNGDLIGYIGTLQPYEGLDLLIDALPRILEQRPDAHLLITGDGNDLAALRTRVDRRGLDARVTFTGRIAHSEVSDVYAACDALIYPRRLTGTTRLTTPLKPLEAMALGKAVLASDIPPMRELIRADVTGLLFAAGDVGDLAAKTVRLLGHASLRRTLGERARAWVVHERQWHNALRGYLPAYGKAVKGFA